MIVWLASYPRSGNTLLRILLNRCFGIETYSVYDDLTDIGADPLLQRIVAHRSHGMKKAEFVEHARKSPEVYFVKTHEMPTDDSSAIYVVRDGRAAVVSRYHHRNIFGKDTTRFTLSQTIRGDLWGGSWSSHVEAWALSGRADTLVLRYEDLIANPEHGLQQTASFLAFPEPRVVPIDFQELHAISPTFFRTGSNEANIAELTPNDLALFWRLHSEAMMAISYADKMPPPTFARSL